MGPTTDFKQWKRSFLNFPSLKATYLIPQLAIRESGAGLDEQAQHYTFTLLLHDASANQCDDKAMKCVSPARPDCAIAAWYILNERLDFRSFARSLTLLDNIMLTQRLGQTLTEYVYFMRQTFDDYNETYKMIDGSAAIHPHNLGLLMLRGISGTGPFGHAKQCVINAFDTDYLLSTDEVMAIILHLAHNMDEETSAQSAPVPDAPPPISAFVDDGRGSHGGRGHTPRGPHGGRGLLKKCSACGSLDHIMSSCIAPDVALLRWTLAKRKMIVQKYGTPCGFGTTHAALLSDVTAADETDGLPTLEDCTDEYDDTEVSVPFNSVAFASSLSPGRDPLIWVIDSACSINLTTFRGDFTTFAPPSAPSRVGGVGVDVKGSA
jgi:hypothetical protein